MHVLYIEDDKDVQRAVKRGLEFAYDGVIIATAEDAKTAISLLQGFKFDVVVSDFDLARGSNGGEIYTWLVANQPHMKTRFIFLSGNNRCDTFNAHWLEKPVRNRDLCNLINTILKETV